MREYFYKISCDNSNITFKYKLPPLIGAIIKARKGYAQNCHRTNTNIDVLDTCVINSLPNTGRTIPIICIPILRKLNNRSYKYKQK